MLYGHTLHQKGQERWMLFSVFSAMFFLTASFLAQGVFLKPPSPYGARSGSFDRGHSPTQTEHQRISKPPDKKRIPPRRPAQAVLPIVRSNLTIPKESSPVLPAYKETKLSTDLKDTLVEIPAGLDQNPSKETSQPAGEKSLLEDSSFSQSQLAASPVPSMKTLKESLRQNHASPTNPAQTEPDLLPNSGKPSVHMLASINTRITTPPAYRDNPPPSYPRLGRRRGWEGEVKIRVLIAPDGTVAKARVASSSGYPILDQSAESAVTKWIFVPATRGNKPVSTWALIPVVFQLEH